MNTYWHFSGPSLRDGTSLPSVGERLPWMEDIAPCVKGYHASAWPLDALRYAPGPYVARVQLLGRMIEHGDPPDKVVAQSRACVTEYVDVDDQLRVFACWSASKVIHLWQAPEIVRRYLDDGDELIRTAAGAAARAAAGDAAAEEFLGRRHAQNEHLAKLLTAATDEI